jgi:ribosomal protein L24E
MERDARVCPFCGHPPGTGVFCASCGRNLSALDRLPTRAEWEDERQDTTADGPAAPPTTEASARAAADAFLDAMHAAGDPGAAKVQLEGHGRFGRTLHAHGWIVRAAHHPDPEGDPSRFEPGLFLAVDGEFHRLDSQVRGWGQRTFPVFHPIVATEPTAPPTDGRLSDDLAALLREHGVARTAGGTP